MSFFNSLKKGLGLGPKATFSVKLEGTPKLGEEFEGTVTLSASESLNVLTIGTRLHHHFIGDYGKESVELDEIVLAERVAFNPGDSISRPFGFYLPFEAVPTLKGFSWEIECWAALQGGADIVHRESIEVGWGELTGAVVHVLTKQFGFYPKDHGADEDGIWVEFQPDAAVRDRIRSLVCSFDESDDGLVVHLQMDPFSPSAIRTLGKDFDPSTNTAYLEFERAKFVVRTPDLQGIFQALQRVIVAS